jgi:ribosomal protein S18 acetylase RimI-like enzyme
MIGSLIFGTYGFLINSYPVAIMNLGIVIINVYYLVQMYGNKDYFQLLETSENDAYYERFKSFYEIEIKSFMDHDDSINTKGSFKVFVLRNMVPAGLLVGTIMSHTLHISIDYVTPQYRDFKIAKFLFDEQKAFFQAKGIETLKTKPGNEKHEKYLKRIGFHKEIENDKPIYIKQLS